eukprot:gnl/Dysnectes_brevis/4657_a6359_690.p1 GENE.gnl/Dysnectes_brevis/4657_a6359_690~~gnl/Dysnectes_brevis/4657_a6359_690.p1  ORF type:complete len:330 (+),score=67.03 gnl/Dysnectes_brevis/4657_a6359_690:43-990(+)
MTSQQPLQPVIVEPPSQENLASVVARPEPVIVEANSQVVTLSPDVAKFSIPILTPTPTKAVNKPAKSPTRILDAVKDVREVEEDLQALRNRIRMLQLEEEQAQKRTSMAQRRAEELRARRRAKEAEQARKAESARKREAERQAKVERNRREAAARREAARSAAKLRSTQRRKQASSVRQQTSSNLQHIKSNKEAARRHAISVRESVRRQKQDLQERRRQGLEAVQAGARSQTNQELHRLQTRRERARREAEDLAAMERHLLTKMEHLHSEQKAAYTDLEAALETSGSPLAAGRDSPSVRGRGSRISSPTMTPSKQ